MHMLMNSNLQLMKFKKQAGFLVYVQMPPVGSIINWWHLVPTIHMLGMPVKLILP